VDLSTIYHEYWWINPPYKFLNSSVSKALNSSTTGSSGVMIY